MNKITLPIVGGSSFSEYEKISRESTYNLMISDKSLVNYPGYRKVIDIAPSGSRGRNAYVSPKYNHIIAVIDDGVYSISNDYAISRLGTLETFSGSVFITENNANEIAIFDNTSNVYVFNYQNDTFIKNDVGFLAGKSTFIDGYIISPHLETNEFRLSEPNNANSFPFSAQTVGKLESSPDVVVACETLERQLFVFGKNITEVWLDIPSSSLLFPFQRQNSISIEYGCISQNTIASGFNRMVWLGSNESSGPTVLVSTGGAPQRITTDGIESVINNIKTPEDSFGFLFEERGHIIYQINFPTENVSYSYDFNTDKWFNVTDNKLNAHIARKLVFFNNTHLFVTDRDGGLYEMNSDFNTYKETLNDDDDGFIVPRIRITPPFRLPDASRFIANNVNLTLEQGYSNDSAVHLSMSKDGAQVFGSKLSKQLNKIGNRSNKLIYRNLGAANDVSFQFQFWGKDRFVVTGGELEVYQ